MSDDNLLIDATTKIFEDLCDPQNINAAKDDSWKQLLWKALEESGLTTAWVPEKFGGAGASISDGFSIIEVAGKFAVPIALPETLLAGWLLSRANINIPDGMMAVAPTRPRDKLTINSNGTLSGQARGVPFASDADHVVAVLEDTGSTKVALIARNSCEIKPSSGLSGDPRDTVLFDNADAISLQELEGDLSYRSVQLMGATIRSVQIGGALMAILELATEHAKTRVAFEKPIAKFQAVQHNLARLANETAAAVAVASSAADTMSNSSDNDEAIFFEASSAKIRTGEAVGEGTAIAHQVFGAIGFTEEHILHRFTQRLWDWRDDFGNESEWAVELGELIAKNGPEELWPLLTTR